MATVISIPPLAGHHQLLPYAELWAPHSAGQSLRKALRWNASGDRGRPSPRAGFQHLPAGAWSHLYKNASGVAFPIPWNSSLVKQIRQKRCTGPAILDSLILARLSSLEATRKRVERPDWGECYSRVGIPSRLQAGRNRLKLLSQSEKWHNTAQTEGGGSCRVERNRDVGSR